MSDDPSMQEMMSALSGRETDTPLSGAAHLQSGSLTHGLCACQKIKPLSEFKVANSGVVTFTDNICKGCEHLAKGLASVVCTKCKEVVARVEPHKDRTGFAFTSDRVYHTGACPNCAPGLTFSPIIEKVIHDRRLGRVE